MSASRRKLKAGGLHLPRERFVLSCGAVLLVSSRPGSPVTAARVHMRGGPAFDPVGKEGLSYLVGGLLDQGTQRWNEEEIAELLETNGGDLSGDANGAGGTIVGTSWKLLLEVLADMLQHPTYPAANVARQKQRLLSRLAVEQDDPRSRGAKLYRQLIYGEHWLGRPAYGTLESIASITPQDLRKHHKKYWVGHRATISVCGDVDPRSVRNLLEKLLANWKKGEPFVARSRQLPERGVRVGAFEADRQQVHVYLGHLGIRREDPDYPALVVMDHILGTGPGFTNRISRRLRDELGLCYSVHADIHSSAGLLPGVFTAYIGTSPEHLNTAVEGFLQEMRRIREEKVQASELDTAKSYLIGSFSMGFERAARRSGYLVSAELHKFPEDHLQRLPEQFAAITIADIQRVAEFHLFPDNCCLAASGPVNEHQLAELVDADAQRALAPAKKKSAKKKASKKKAARRPAKG